MLIRRKSMRNKNLLKFGIAGLAGSGKTTYLVLLNGMFAAQGLFEDIAYNLEVDEIKNIIRRFSFSDVSISGKASFMYFLNIIDKFWMQGKGTPKTLADKDIRRMSIDINVPLYKEKATVLTKLSFPDPTGEAISILGGILENLDVEKMDPAEIRLHVIKELKEIAPNNQNAASILPFLEPTDYDGFIVMIDAKAIADSITTTVGNNSKKKNEKMGPFVERALLFALLKLLIPNQRKKRVTLTILFTKSLMRKKIDKDMLKQIISRYSDYFDLTFKRALDFLKSEYSHIYTILRKHICSKKLNFAGAFFYDAFLSESEIPVFHNKEDDNKKVIRSLNVILPLVHTVHVHLGKKTFVPDYENLVKNLCSPENLKS